MKGFFSAEELTRAKAPLSLLPKCGLCGLMNTCKSPKMGVAGKGLKRILVVAEAPGPEEDEQNKQLVGNSGRYLESLLHRLGINMREDCWLTNALICRPPDNKIEDIRAVDWCRPNLIKTIKELEPLVIIPIGGVAVKSLIEWLYDEEVGVDTRNEDKRSKKKGDGISKWRGWAIPSQRINAWVCPTYHPSFLLHEKNNAVLEMMILQDLERAVYFAERGLRPWDKLPDYKSRVQCIFDPDNAAFYIRNMIGPVSFDFETNMLKPDSKDAAIHCCSVSDGTRTIAFPWVGEVIPAMKELLLSDRKKYGWNIKFEQRWAMKHLGIKVKRWAWDGMQAAHILDNRPDITGLKFQVFARLGQESYDSHVKGFLKSQDGGGNTPNRIKEVPLKDLLLYCGLDSFFEHHISVLQMLEMGVQP